MKPITKYIFLLTLTALVLCGCTSRKRPQAVPQTTSPAVTTQAPETTIPTATAPAAESQQADPSQTGFDALIDQYTSAVLSGADPGQMIELGLNYMIPGCLQQDERAHVGYYVGDFNLDGQDELIIAANSESEFYTGLIFAMYVLEDGQPQLALESSERSRWYYAGNGILLSVSSSSAAQSWWYLCDAHLDMALIDGVECNGLQYPDDPWMRFTEETWTHIPEEEANQKIMELSSLVTNLEITEFQ